MFDKRLFALPAVRRALIMLLVAAFAHALCVLGEAWGLSTAIARIWNGGPISDQVLPIAVFAACFLASQAVAWISDTRMESFARSRVNEIRERLMERTFSGDARLKEKAGSAAVAQTLIEGAAQVESYLKLVLPKMVGVVVIPLIIFIAAIPLDIVSAFILLVLFPIIVFFMILIGNMAQDKAQRQYRAFQTMSNHFIDTLRGLPTIKALGAGRARGIQVFETSEVFRRATIDTLKVATLSGAVLDLIATAGVAAVAIMLGLHLIDGSITLAPALAVLFLSPEYFKPIRAFAGDFHASLDGKNALAAMLDLEERTGAGTEETPAEEKAAPAVWNDSSVLSLRDVSVAYEDAGFSAIEEATIDLHGHEVVALIGPSGSGKSTLASLIAGFLRPSTGAIAVSSGIEAPIDVDLSCDAWRRQVVYIPQNPYVFKASLRDNLRFYAPDASDEAVLEAARAAGLDALVDEMPDGLDAVIGEGGRGLSGGQAQRIALARAFLVPERRILVLDEPTEHLDVETELELKQRMLPLLEDRLCIIVTHRLHWLDQADRIFHMEGGRLVEVEDAMDEQHAADDGACIAYDAVLTFAPTATGEAAHLDEALSAGRSPSVRASRVTCSLDDRASDDAAFTHAADSADALAPGADTPERDRWVRPYFSMFRPELIRAVALGVAALAFATLLMFSSGYLISRAAERPDAILLVYLPLICVQVFGGGKPVLRYFERLVSHDWVFRMTSDLRLRLYAALEKTALAPGSRRSAGEVLGLVSDDIGHIQNLYLRSIFPAVTALLLYLLVVIALGCLSLPFAAGTAVLLGVAAFVLPLISLRANRTHLERSKNATDACYANLTDDVLGSNDIVLAGRGAEFLETHRAAQSAIAREESAVERRRHVIDASMAAVFCIGTCMTIVWAGERFAEPGAMGNAANWVAAFVLGFLSLAEAFSPLPHGAAVSCTYAQSITHLNRIPEAEDEARAIRRACTKPAKGGRNGQERGSDDRDAFSNRRCHADMQEDARLPNEADAEHPAIDVREVAYVYDGSDRPALDGITLDIPFGQKVAVLGRSGSGKSTLLSLIRGDAAPRNGSIRIAGREASSFGNGIARIVGYVQQDPYVFDQTLRANLRIADPNATDDDLRGAMESVGLAPALARLPRGLNTLCGEDGARFSGGERHRIALARVLLSKAPIIMLDEPMSGLDPDTETGLLDTFMNAAQNRTLVMVTHHLAGIERFDRVVFIEDGRIAMDGTPAALARSDARFQALLEFDANC